MKIGVFGDSYAEKTLNIPEIYQQYYDLRPGHISSQNQQILADLLNTNLEPGIFQTQFEYF